MVISELNVYPVKSCRGLSLTSSPVFATGLLNDRRFMVVMENGSFATQRQFPAMALIHTQISGRTLVLQDLARHVDVTVPLDPDGPLKTVKVWDDTVDAVDCGDQAAHFFREALHGKKAASESLRLVCIQEDAPRHVTAKYAAGGRYPFGFADAFPFLVIGSASLADLNARLGKEGKPPVPMNRFRTNFVVETKVPYEEDGKAGIRIGGGVEIKFLKACSRCQITMTDQETAKIGAEPLQILGTYRKSEAGKILFGQNGALLSEPGAVVTVGDSVTWL